ncbi:hypothetical protein ABIA18_004411 [Sinorhizobium fredii]
MRPSSGPFLCVFVASLCLSGRCEGVAVASILTLVFLSAFYIAVNRFRARGEPATDSGPLAAPALAPLH